MEDLVLKQLYEPFQLRERRGVGNKTFKYVETSDIVDRMNRIFKGEWSTEVKSVNIIEDNVLMCVRVYVPSLDGKQVLWHDGYASHPLARHTSGNNQGKIVDIGNSYKSAMSKAIKTAVSKWGVALNLDDEQDHDGASFISTGFTPTTTIEKTNVVDSVLDAGAPLGFPGIQTFKPVVDTVAPKVDQPPKAPVFGGASAVQVKQNVQNTGFTSSIPSFIPENSGASTDFDSGVTSTTTTVPVTSVQKVAIEQVMSLNGLTFQQLLNKAIDRTTDLPRSIDDVTYLDAVKLIQYGNHLRKL